MTLLTISAAGTSSTISPTGSKFTLTFSGIWVDTSGKSAYVSLEKLASDSTTWQECYRFSGNGQYTVDVVGAPSYRLNTVGTPTLKCDVQT